MALPVEQVVKQLEDSGIISSETLKDFVPPKADPKDGDELVQALVKSEKLTNFQGQQVKGGRAKSLKLGQYAILEKIGAGGMGQVFKAIHRRMDRIVAIKMLPPAMTKDAAAIARFEREVKAAAKLRHPNIVAADDAGQAGAAHFLVMEYVNGKDLSATVKKDGPLPVNKAVNFILQAARGLEFAHSKGVIHRDIKPANLLLGSDGIVKILDMGLARIESSGPAQNELTSSGTIMGTVDYMSPEQALNTRHADQRADIYSLGMSLYYLLAGKAAYCGDTAMQKLMAHQNQPIPSLQDVQSTVSKQLDSIFKKMVAKKIEQRYQTMSEVVEALEGLGYGGSSTGRKGDVASTLDLSSADKKKLRSQAKKKPLGSITEVVASEKSKNLILKIVGGSFGTIIAPILVFYLIRHLEREEKPAAGSGQPAVVATNAATVGAPRAPGVSPGIPSTTTPAPDPQTHGAISGRTNPAADAADSDEPRPLVAPFDAPPTKLTKPWETPEFQQFIADTQKLPAEKQVEAVLKKLVEFNPNFEGWAAGTIVDNNGVVTSIGLWSTNLSDISPVRVFAGLQWLFCTGKSGERTAFADLSPLQGMMLTKLFVENSSVSDLSPLTGCTNLQFLKVTGTKVTPAQVAALQKALPNCEIEWDDPAKATTPAPAPAGKK